MAKFQLPEVRVAGIPKFSSKITPKKICLFYSNNHDVDYQYFFEFYNSYVLDLARFEDHTFASFKCHCLRKCSRGQKLWSTDLAETWHRRWV